MYITDFSIKGFKLIDILGNIKQIDVEAKSQVQIIIGTNGCGKSSIMSELSPLPANKNLYYPGGYKKLTILHNGEEYKISSTFEKKNGKHSFIRNNGPELNVSGLSTLQIELCVAHLGYSPLIDDLTHCRYKICSMSPADRKSLLFSMTPAVPDFIIQLHKQAKSELRACKNNLNLLYTRKAVIEEKLLSLEVLQQLNLESIEVEKQQLKVNNDVFLLQNRIQEYRKECQTLGIPRQLDLDVIQTYRRKVQQLLMSSPITLTSDTVDDLLSSLQSQQGQYQQIKLNAENNYQQLQRELAEYDPAVLEGQDTGQQDCLLIIETRMKRLDETSEYTKLPMIPEVEFEHHVKKHQQLYELFSEQTITEVKQWYPRKSHLKIEQKSKQWKNNVSKKEYQLQSIQAELMKIKEEESTLLNGPITKLENCITCDYSLAYSTRREKLNEQKQKLLQHESVLNKTLDKDKRVSSRFEIALQELQQQQEFIHHIQEILQTTIWRSSGVELLSILNTDSQKWLHELKMTIQAQIFHNEKITLEKEIRQAQSTIEALLKVQAPAIDILKKIYQEKLNQLKEYQKEAINAQNELNRIAQQQNYCQQYIRLKDSANRILQDIDHYFDYTTLDEYVKYLQDEYLPILIKQKQELDQKIFMLTGQLKEQDTLRARYTEEIISIIEKIEYKQKVFTFLEMGLSPETGMTHHHLLKFINTILENVNFILSHLWTYPFRVELLQEGDDVNCEFMASCNNKPPSPLNKLSTSQEAGMNFAFFIALVYAMQGTDYPMYFDECDIGFDWKHRQMYLEWLKQYIESQYSPQLWMVYHDPSLYSGFLYKDVICLKKENVCLPQEVNLYTTITY